MSNVDTRARENRQQLVEWMVDANADIRLDRFITAARGDNRTYHSDHTNPDAQLPADSPRLSGNYGIHFGDGLIGFDIDDVEAFHESGAAAVLPLDAAFAILSAHAEDEPTHYLFAVADDEGMDEALGALPAGSRGKVDTGYCEIAFGSMMFVGPGSQRDADKCDSGHCNGKCEGPDSGWYDIAYEGSGEPLDPDTLLEALGENTELGDTGENKAVEGGSGDETPTPEAGETASDDGETAESDGSDAPDAMPPCYREALKTRVDPSDADVDNQAVNTYAALLGLWAGYDAEDVAEHMTEEFAPGESAGYDLDADETESQVRRLADKVDRDSPERPPSPTTLKEAGILPDIAPDTCGERCVVHTTASTDGGTQAASASAAGPAGPDANAATLTPLSVKAEAGIGEDDSIAELNDRPKAAAVWELVVRNSDVHVRVRRDNGSLWAYDGGIWKPEGERALRHAGRQALTGKNYGPKILSKLKAQAQSDPRAEVEGDEFGVPTGTVAVENGSVDLEAAAAGAGDGALRDLRPDDYALAQLPVEYDPTAEYDEWASLVEEWAEEGKADALQEYVGYCLHIGALPIHRAVLLVGAGSNGKGTFLHVVRALLGQKNTSSIELQTLANEKDAVADFYGSLANIDDDLSTRKLGQGKGMFKKLVGGDRVRARNLYESGFEFDATGKHLYAANKVPNVDIPDDDEAFWRRWLLVEFPNYYPPTERDPQLRERLTEPESLAGVLNWAIEGWRRLLDQGYFTNEERLADDKRRRWQSWGKAADEFISECVESDEDADRITTGQAYQRFKAWCRENGKDHDGSQRAFTNKLKREPVGYGKHKIDGTSTLGYSKLGLSDDVPEADDDDDPDDSTQERL